MNIRIFASSVLAKPLNNAQIVRGVFVYIRSLSKYTNGKITSLHETLNADRRLERLWKHH